MIDDTGSMFDGNPYLRASPFGICVSSISAGEGAGLTSSRACLSAGPATGLQLGPTLKAARIEALVGLRAARNKLRRIKILWVQQYGQRHLNEALIRSQKEWDCAHPNEAMLCTNDIKLTGQGRRGFSRTQRLIRVESARITDIATELRKGLIRDNLADARMIDDQMAQDLGL
ncbi:hypothetical protein C6380_05210 [Pseudomonas syringae pv. actinidiae]|uniref:hypothetical protein n=1 Tax=Pseudomonas syringae TaxID=317 RepID=UPI000BB57EC2|nr:hypothetical protein [Pseudomonas syringae]PBK51298.1 hypothetical protein BUE61_17565 [Pseudomonas syringae pv. actinidiae]PBK51866.1 hypothetical protein BUE60_17790 [Pseudomonas syringae pv. actinidiae]RJX54347.1 hypothetical protein C6379_15935 [Pseudomonas syringae pv. actinidiae]RJX60198.1 hypothetical protein C6380_05210 [Pseudomonas syringae pv. actinidiae]RJX60323.1 hypothetical protein C6383_13805 [Pseudomonas syringae pv. actinidiae]